MRLLTHYALLATVAIIAAKEKDEPRDKRDLNLIKGLIMKKLFGTGEELFPLAPGPDCGPPLVPGPELPDIVIDSATRPLLPGQVIYPLPDIVQPELVDVNPHMTLVSSYLGTNTLDGTLEGLNSGTILLEPGVLNEEHLSPLSYAPLPISPIRRPVPIEPINIAVKPVGIERPVYSCLQNIPSIPIFEKLCKPISIPLPELAYPTKYSYKQKSREGTMSWLANDSKNVIVIQTNKPVQLPNYLNNRFQEIIRLGSIPVVQGVPLEFEKPTKTLVHINDLLQPVGVTTSTIGQSLVPSSYSYKNKHNDGTSTTDSGSGKVKESKDTKSLVVVNQAMAPLPLPNVYANRIENVAAKAHRLQVPVLIEQTLYEPQMPIDHNNINKVLASSYYNTNGEYQGSTGFSYKTIHGGSNNDLKSTSFQELNNVREIENFNQLPGANLHQNGFSYKTLHSDGSETTHLGSVQIQEHKTVSTEEQSKILPPMVAVTAPLNSYETLYRPDMPVYREPVTMIIEELSNRPQNQVYDDRIHASSGSQQLQGSSGFSYKTIQGTGVNDHQSISYQEVSNARGVGFNQFPVADVPQSVFSYKTVHSDGLATTHLGSGQIQEHQLAYARDHSKIQPSIVTVTATPTIQDPLYRPDLPVYSESSKVYIGGVSKRPYLQINEDRHNINSEHFQGSSGFSFNIQNGIQNDELVLNSEPSLVLKEENANSLRCENGPKNTKCSNVISTYDGDNFNRTQSQQQHGSDLHTDGFSYKQVHSDGSETTHLGSGQIQEHQIASTLEHSKIQPSIVTVTATPTIHETFYHPDLPVYSEPTTVYIGGPSSRPYVQINDDRLNIGSEHFQGSSGFSDNIQNGIRIGEVVPNADFSLVYKKENSSDQGCKHKHKNTTCVTSDANGNKFNRAQHQHGIELITDGFSYKQVHSDGSETTNFGYGQIQEHPVKFDVQSESSFPMAQIPVKSLYPYHSNQQIFIDSQNVAAKPVLSQYTYKQINHNHPDHIEPVAKMENIGKVESAINISNFNNAIADFSLNRESDNSDQNTFIPPSTNQMPLTSPTPIAETTLKEVETTIVTTENKSAAKATARPMRRKIRKRVKTVPRQPTETTPIESVTSNSDQTNKSNNRFRQVARGLFRKTTTSVIDHTTEAITTSSEFSFSDNPIVVMPQQPTVTSKHSNADGTSATSSDNNIVSVITEENRTASSVHRGDIPDISY